MFDSRPLQQLVDEHRYDELLREVTLDDIARAWIRYQHQETHVDEPWENDPDWWAVDLWMDEPWWTDEARVRAGIVAIIATSDDGDAGIIGAAIMEVFIAEDEDRLVWLEEQAHVSERFRRSLANVYVWGCAPDWVAERVESAAGVPLPRPRPLSAQAKLAVKRVEALIHELGFMAALTSALRSVFERARPPGE